ncbi:MAG TPA: hypothetical protein VHM30_20275 [Gemmatimonadaceae bacterium]|nr:hypothetical protein [Gemmatimonadaceae bacterium]
MADRRSALAACVVALSPALAAAQQLLPAPPSDSGKAVERIVAPRTVAAHFALPDAAPVDDRKTLASAAAGIDRRTDRRQATDGRTTWWAPLASAVVPGAGQARLDQDRFVGYLAMEGFLWARYFVDRRQGVEERNRYRDLALRVSRAQFGGPKPQGDFEYYERMEHWIASGAYDTDPGSSFVPESDTTTFNGAMWLLARRTYWPSPDTPPPPGSNAYAAALRFYERYAVPSDFQWSWRDAPLHQDVYRRHIRASNDAFRRTITDVGAVLANHVLSTVDAYVSLRLRSRDPGAASDAGVDISATVSFQTLGNLARRARLSTPE